MQASGAVRHEMCMRLLAIGIVLVGVLIGCTAPLEASMIPCHAMPDKPVMLTFWFQSLLFV